MLKFIKLALIVIWAAILGACNAPRFNPLDPGNTVKSLADINGTVETFSVPYQGIPGVDVFWQPGNILVKTNDYGKFEIDNVEKKDGLLIFRKSGFSADTFNVVWAGQNKISAQINLNKIPVLDSILLYTEVINQYFPAQSYRLSVDTRISDSDNDIDSVFLQNDYLNLRFPLEYNLSSKSYQLTLSNTQMKISDIEETIGLEFNIIVKDLYGREFKVGSDKVTRVIKTAVTIQSPANGDVESDTPVLKWNRFNVDYKFNYMVEIYTNDFANSQLVFKAENISSDSTSHTVSQPLEQKEYYWVVWVIDQFNNRARSRPATFTVQ